MPKAFFEEKKSIFGKGLRADPLSSPYDLSKDRNIYCLTTSVLDELQILLVTGPLVPQKKIKK